MSGGKAFFSSPLLTTTTTTSLGPLSPGRRYRYVHHSIEVGPKASMPVALALHELYKALLLEKVQVALDRPGATGEPPGQGLHARPAQARLVVGVVGEGAVGGDYLCRDPCEHEVADLGYTGKVRSHRHINLLEVLRRVRTGDGKIHQRGGFPGKRIVARRFFYALFTGAYFTCTDILALATRMGGATGTRSW